MQANQIFYELIWPYGKKDNLENAKTVIENIKTQEDYYTVVSRCIGYNSKVILKLVTQNQKFEEFKNFIKNNQTKHSGQKLETMKERLINQSLKSGDPEIFQIFYNLFDMTITVPEYSEISDIVYYNEDFINTKTNIVYLLDFERPDGFPVSHFENVITSLRNVKNAGIDLIYNIYNEEYSVLIQRFNTVRKCELTNQEEEIIQKFCIEYCNFYNTEFNEIIDEIQKYKEITSKSDCWGILYNYIGREPSRCEIDSLWDHAC